MTTCLLQVSAATFAQKFTYAKKDATYSLVFKEIIKQTGYKILYSDQILDKTKTINVDFKGAELKEVMETLLKNQPLSYEIDETTILIKEKEPTFLDRLAKRWASIDANGRVVDSENRPLPGASVKVKKTGKAVSTDEKGMFFLRGVEEGAVLIVSFVGYLPKEASASANMGNVVLEQSLSKLDEVQVIAYGTTTQRLSTGNTFTVKASDIEKAPVGNPLLALAGRIPGVVITQSSGLPGSNVSVQIQGQNSISKGNDPFYVIDGVPFPSQNLSGITNYLIGAGNPLSFINPGDIESITVLKDADATAIYGSRAANGAILITTKKSKAGQTKVDINVQNGIGQIPHRLDVMNTSQYLEMRREAIKNDGLTIPTTPTPEYYDLTLYDQNRSTDWQKELIGKTASYQDIQTTISGGTDNTQFSFGANYHRETTVFPGSFADKKGGVHLSLINTSVNKKFQMRFTGNYLNDNNKLPGVDLTSTAISLMPNAPLLYNSDGSLNWDLYNGVSTWYNPLATSILLKYNKESNNLVSNVELSYEFIKGLNLKSSFGYNRLQTDDIKTTPQTASPPNITGNVRSAAYGSSNINTWIIEPQLTYQVRNGFGNLDFLIGSTFQSSRNKAMLLSGWSYGSDAQLDDIKAAGAISADNSLQSVYKYNALFGRVSYNLRERYMLNFTARRDGSSRFGSENLFHNFFAIGGAWIFSNEKWLIENLPGLSYGKLKLSYGTTGSDQIGDYSFMSLYSPYSAGVSYGGGTAIKPTGLTNPYLQWEETKKLNLGLDFGLFQDRLIFNLNYYRNRSGNQLIGQALPIITGFNGITQNFNAKVENTGFELSLNTVNIKSGSFSWLSSFNFTRNRNKLIKYDNLENSGYKDYYVIGEPISIIKAYQYAGINSQTGFYQFRKADGTITDSPIDPDDKNVLINTTPKFYGGLSNSFNYKGFSLDFLLQFVRQTGLDQGKLGNSLPPGFYSSFGASILGNQPLSVINRWRQPNDPAKIQKFTTDFGSGYSAYYFATQSDFSYSDASFIRLKNLSLSWSIPKGVVNKRHFQNARIYFQGQNLLTFTSFKGFDPENQSYSSLPPLRVLTLGIQLTL